MRELSARDVSLCFPCALCLPQCEASEQGGHFQMDNQCFLVWVTFSVQLQHSWIAASLNRIRAQSLWLSDSHSCLAGYPKIKSVIWPRGSKFSWKEYTYQVSREGRIGNSPSLSSVTEGLDCRRTMHMDIVSILWLSAVYLNIITNFAGLHFS